VAETAGDAKRPACASSHALGQVHRLLPRTIRRIAASPGFAGESNKGTAEC
jgi:hypothetical protein